MKVVAAVSSQLILLVFVMACSRSGSDAAMDSAESFSDVTAPTTAGTPDGAQAQSEDCIPKEERIRELQAELDALRLRFTERHPEFVATRSQLERLQQASPVVCDEPA